jgi:DNA-binding transcriptional regulator YiaG
MIGQKGRQIMTVAKVRPSLFDRLSTGLQEGIEFARGERTLKTTVVTAPPVVGEKEIRALRRQLHLTPEGFAELLRIKPKTVLELESGKQSPSGPVLRLLELFGSKPALANGMLHTRSEKLVIDGEARGANQGNLKNNGKTNRTLSRTK